jgi:hypothetical protein
MVAAVPTQLYAQPPAPLKNIEVTAAVEYAPKNHLFTFGYVVRNPGTNTGQISMVDIDISRAPETAELSSEGLVLHGGVNRKGEMMMRPFDEELRRMNMVMKKPIIPVGVRPPQTWRGAITVMGTAHWGSTDKANFIGPDNSLSGFVLMSRGIPSIRDVSVQPHWILVVDGYVSDEDIEESKRIEEEITFKGKTIGPTAPPVDLKPVDFLDNIIEMKHEAFSLGWITNKGIERSLDAKLDAARKKLTAGDYGTARNILNAFANEVEAQGCETREDCPKGKHLLPEAYALLKYNAQYLADNLK